MPTRPHRLRGQPLFDLGALPGCTYKQARSKSKHATRGKSGKSGTSGKSSNILHCEQLSTYLVSTRLSNLLYIEVLQ